IALLTSILLAVFLSSSGWSQTLGSIKVGYLSTSVSFAPLWIAKETGLFTKNGVSTELIYVQPAVLTQSMLAGELPMAISGGSTMIEANLRGADFVILGSWLKNPGLNYLITRKEISQTTQLKGKKFGISRLGAAPHRILQLALAKLGIDPSKDVSFLQIGNPSVVLLAIQAGSVDAGLADVEVAYAAKKLGLHVLLEIRNLGIDYLTNDIVSTKSYVEKHENAVRGFLKSIVEAIHYFKTQPKPTREILTRYTGSVGRDPASLQAGYEYYAQDGFQLKPYVSVPGIKAVLEHIAATNPKAKEAKPEQFYNSRFVQELDQSGYIDSLYR
ncbi:MAG: ABC transporter substrate-binding protein, partial [Gammaproteobacteria bacterium]